MICRHCKSAVSLNLIDLGSAPPSNAYLTSAQLGRSELYVPLRVFVCEECWLAQTEDFTSSEDIFDADYAYFSSYSSSWISHCRSYLDAAVKRFDLGSGSFLLEVASNDGYLLDLVKDRGIPCAGVEPAIGAAKLATAKGLRIHNEFFGAQLAAKLVKLGESSDLVVANNVLAHVPDINDFVEGFRIILKPGGVASFEFPHLMKLLTETQFDTIYHEHFSYLSLSAVHRIFECNGLSIFDVQEVSTHGGSLRVFAQLALSGQRPEQHSVRHILKRESDFGICSHGAYSAFQTKAEKVKDDFLRFLIDSKRAGKTVAAYGAAAKGNTLLNYAGVRSDLISYVIDKNSRKQGKFLPGSRIPIMAPDYLQARRPDYLIILPWNIAKEVREQNAWVAELGTQFVTAVPALRFF